MCVCVTACVCVSLSAELCPCPCLLAARSHPAAGLWLGRGVGFLTQRGADCSGTCFNRWSRLESVITSERGLEERGCLPGAVWSPLPFNPKSQHQGTNPSMSDGRSGEETREENTERNPRLASHSASSLLSCLSGTQLSHCHFFCPFSAIFLSPLILQRLCLLVCSIGSKFLMQHTVRSESPQVQ